MADFRKLMLTLIVGALLFATVASAQPYSCTATAVPTLVRVEGLADYVGDVLLVCSGSVPAQGIVANIRMTLSANITSNPLSSSSVLREATLILREGDAGLFKGYSSTSGPTPFADGSQNVYQALAIGNTEIEWQGVVLAGPGSGGANTIRLTNVRANAQGLGSGTPVVAVINITAPTSVPITNNSLVVANTRLGIDSFSVTSVDFKRCEPPSAQSFSLRFVEGFGTAFKPWANNLLAAVPHDVPGGGYQDERGFNPTNFADTAPAGGGVLVAPTVIGAADQGTRFVSRIKNVPSGVTLTVNGSVTSDRGLVLTYCYGETATSSGACAATSTSVPLDSGGNGVIVYEVTGYTEGGLGNSVSDIIDIPVFVSFPFPGTLGTATASGNFAPICTASSCTVASWTNFEPRFVDSAVDKTAFTISPCRTILLFPFITSQAGFDTGIAISNTSRDPLGTAFQAGSCGLTYFGNASGAAGPALQTSPSIPAGGHLVFSLSSGGGVYDYNDGFTACSTCSAPLFTGYLFAICDFQFAHGYAFISDLGSTKLAQGYLALVIPDRGVSAGSRKPQDNSVGASANQGEQLGN